MEGVDVVSITISAIVVLGFMAATLGVIFGGWWLVKRMLGRQG